MEDFKVRVFTGDISMSIKIGAFLQIFGVKEFIGDAADNIPALFDQDYRHFNCKQLSRNQFNSLQPLSIDYQSYFIGSFNITFICKLLIYFKVFF